MERAKGTVKPVCFSEKQWVIHPWLFISIMRHLVLTNTRWDTYESVLQILLIPFGKRLPAGVHGLQDVSRDYCSWKKRNKTAFVLFSVAFYMLQTVLHAIYSIDLDYFHVLAE